MKISRCYIVYICLLIPYLFLSGNTYAQKSTKNVKVNVAKKRKIIWGITGHPISQEAYLHQQSNFNNAIADQLDLLKKCGLTWYRVDVPTDTNGNVQNFYPFEDLKKQAGIKGIKLLPLLYLVGLDYNRSAADMYNLGLKCGKNFAVQHGRFFTHYEIGNEQEADLLVDGWRSPGLSVTDYDAHKTTIVASYLKGLAKGIKSIEPKAKIIINTAGWVHYGFLERLIAEGVEFDITGYHWYSDMGKLTEIRDYKFNMPDLLFKKFGKPVWITEISNRNGSNDMATEQQQATWAVTYIKEAKSNPHIEAMFFYELYDQPVFQSAEGRYGIVKWTKKYVQPVYKKAFYSIKENIKSN